MATRDMIQLEFTIWLNAQTPINLNRNDDMVKKKVDIPPLHLCIPWFDLNTYFEPELWKFFNRNVNFLEQGPKNVSIKMIQPDMRGYSWIALHNFTQSQVPLRFYAKDHVIKDL